MKQKFKLGRAGEYGSITPTAGEELGRFLGVAAEEKEQALRDHPNGRIVHWGPTVAQVYYLAADAYDCGAAVTIGHNRADRYMERANELRAKADSIIHEAEAQRQADVDAGLKAAFLAGYEGSGVTRYAFEQRDAALVGQYFAKQSMPVPDTIRLARGERGEYWIEAGDCRYSVKCPGGRITDAIVTIDD